MRVRTLSPQSILHHISIIQTTVNGCCDFLAQCILVRMNHCTCPFIDLNLQRSTVVGSCGVKISASRSFLYSWQSHTWISHLILIWCRFQFIASSSLARVTWRNDICTRPNFDCCLGSTMIITSLATSMAVNALGDGLDILKVFLDVNPTFEELRIKLGSNGGTKLRHIIFVIIESGMLLFAIQLIRVALYILSNYDVSPSDYIIVINQMFNVIIRSVHSYLFCLLITFTRASHQQ